MVSENFNAKTARACDSCVRKRARWYCAADDAFLCQPCDASVHTANPFVRRHRRVRLKTASMKQLSLEPSWHHGFTKKPRTPRHGKHHRPTNSDKVTRNPLHLVPEMEMGPDENSYEENDEQAQLVYRVPLFDPFAAQLCLSGNTSEGAIYNDDKCMLSGSGNYDGNISLHGFYSSDMHLEDFAADVDNLLGKRLDDEESFDMETLGFLNFAEKLEYSMELTSSRSNTGKVKFQKDEEMEGTMGIHDMNRETSELNFDSYDDKAGVGGGALILKKEERETRNHVKQKEEKKFYWRLIMRIAAWADQKSVWTTGERLDSVTSTDCMGGCGGVHYPTYGGMGSSSVGMMMDGSGREARVSRYREKRRTRLFSKKIRYEVRKLNAEKRPRMKGRFVKRPNFAAASTPFP